MTVRLPLSLLLCALAFGAGGCLYAQDFNKYQPLESQNPIPDNFLNPTVPELPDVEKMEEETTDSLFMEAVEPEDNYALLAELKSSGKVVFNDPISTYLGRVADKLLSANPVLRNKLRFYVIKSSAVNSFTSLEGDVFLTLGYISQMETEAELAYALCREVANFELKHTWDNYDEKLRLGANMNEFVKPGLEERLFARCVYKPEQAAAADIYAFGIYKESQYHLFAPNYVFDYLLYASYPFEDMYFTQTYLETDYLVFPSEYVLADSTLKRIPEESLFDNENKSPHKNILSRRNDFNQIMGPLFETGGRKWTQVSEKDFELTRQIARYELIRLYLLERRYVEALYISYALHFYDPYSQYLQKAKVKALYGLAMYTNKNRKFQVVADWKNTDGYWQQLVHLLNRLSPGEMNGLALIHAWKAHKKYPDDTEITAITDELFRELTTNHFLSLSELYDEPLDPNAKPAAAKTETNVGGVTYKSTKTANASFIRYAFVDLKKDPEFVEKFEFYRKNNKWVEVKLTEVAGYDPNEKDKRAKNTKPEAPATTPLNINRWVVNEPDYHVMDRRTDNFELQMNNDLEGKTVLSKLLEERNTDSLITTVVLSPRVFNKAMAAAYNDMSYLNEWMDERALHNEVTLLSMDQSRAEGLQRKYNTAYFGHIGVTRTIDKRQNKGAVLAATIIALPALPYGIYYSGSPEYTTSFSTRMWDIRNGAKVYENYHVRKVKDKENNLQKAINLELESIRKLEK